MKPNTTDPEVLPADTNVSLMPRADLAVIWNSYREQAERLKATALTLTVTSVDQKAEMKLARATRLEIRQVRIAIEKRRKELGEDLLRETQKINGAAKELRDMLEPLEQRLLEQEEFAERAEAARIAELTENRTSQLMAVDATIPIGIGSMPNEEFNRILDDAIFLKKAREEQAAKEEAERIAREEEERKERERIKAENERLRAEAEAMELELRKEREAAEAKLAEERRIADQERKRIEAERAKERAEVEAVAAKLKAEAAALQRAEDERLAEIAKQEADAKKAAAEAAKAPDKKKLSSFSATIRAMEIPALMDKQASMKLAEARERFASFVDDLAAKL